MFASQLPGSRRSSSRRFSIRTPTTTPWTATATASRSSSEILFNQGLNGYSGFDPNNPSRVSTVNTVDPNVKAPITHELLFGIDRQLAPNFGVSATFTYRRDGRSDCGIR